MASVKAAARCTFLVVGNGASHGNGRAQRRPPCDGARQGWLSVVPTRTGLVSRALLALSLHDLQRSTSAGPPASRSLVLRARYEPCGCPLGGARRRLCRRHSNRGAYSRAVLPLAWPYQSHDWRPVGSRPSTSPVTRRSARPRSVENSRCLRRVFGALVRCRLGLRHRRLRLQSVFLHALWRGRLPLGGLCDARRGRGLRWRRRKEGRGSWAD